MPKLTHDYVQQVLNEKIKPEKPFKFVFSASRPMKNFAIGITEDKIYILSLSFFGAKPKDYFNIDFKDIVDISFQRGDIKGAQGTLQIKTSEKTYTFMTTNMLFGGDQQTTEAQKAYEFIVNTIKK